MGRIQESNGQVAVVKMKEDLTLSPSPKGEGKCHPRVNGAVKGSLYRSLFEAAKEMRKKSTQTEEILWESLRNNGIGFKFRRQHIIDRFIVDFYCVRTGLVVEVDGEIHNLQVERDKERDTILDGLGCRVIRFTNEEILNEFDKVLRIIKDVNNLLLNNEIE